MIRETPRTFPIFYQIQILLGGIYISLGFGLLIFAGISFLIFNEKLDYETLAYSTVTVAFLGSVIIFYSLTKNYRKIKLLTWGHVIFGKLESKDQGYREMTGNFNFACIISYVFRLKSYTKTFQIREAYEMEEGDFFILIIDEEHPERVICLEQVSESFRQFFKKKYQVSIKEAERKLDQS